MRTKICIKCNQEKLAVQFRKTKRNKEGTTNTCNLCNAREWRENYYRKKQQYRERINARRRARLEETRKLNRESYHRNKASRTDIIYMKRYGITVADRDAMFEAQNGCCAICGAHESNFVKALSIDHDHANGKARALLCGYCNRWLVGKHTTETAKKVYEYLLKYDEPEKK